ncbi:MAG: hypothetical protein LUD54_02290 [Oscillospiraceae bacterium]|nr:hypothetical protein [Oscillospiraceae bacterium]
MLSKTSCFNKTMFFKNVRRFWPLWALYLAVWIFALPLTFLGYDGYQPGSIYSILTREILQWATIGGTIIGAIFGLFAAMAVFGFLYNARATHGMACLPVRREGQFLSAVAAGILPLLAANVIVFLLSLLAALRVPGNDSYVPELVQWLASVSLILLFYYGFAVFCAQLTGSIIGLPVLYGILNFVAIGFWLLIKALLSLFLYGAEMNTTQSFSRWFSPTVAFFSDVRIGYDTVGKTTKYFLSGWGVLILYAVVGLALLATALLLFRRRRMESAGDVIAVRCLKPVFRWSVSICFGIGFTMLLYVILYAYSGETAGATKTFWFLLLFLLVGAALGWFIAEMFLQKSFRVFARRSWSGLGVCCLVLAALMLGAKLDVVGYESRIPAADEVDYVQLDCAYADPVTLWEAESIELVRALHAEILDGRDRYYERITPSDYTRCYCTISYYLTNGSVVERDYYLNYLANDQTTYGAAATAQDVMNCAEAVQNRSSISGEEVYSGDITVLMTAEECAAVAGCETVEDYLLRIQCGYTDAQIERMDEETRRTELARTVAYYSNGSYYNSLYDAYENYSYDYDLPTYDLPAVPEGAAASSSTIVVEVDHDYGNLFNWVLAHLDEIDYSRVYFNYYVSLNAAEAQEFYETVIVPDVLSGTLGHAWVISDDESRNSISHVTVSLDTRTRLSDDMEDDDYSYSYGYYDDVDYRYHYYSYVADCDAAHVAAWCAGRGLIMHSRSEVSDNTSVDVDNIGIATTAAG